MLLNSMLITQRDNNTISKMPYIPCVSRDMGLFFARLMQIPNKFPHTHQMNIS